VAVGPSLSGRFRDTCPEIEASCRMESSKVKKLSPGCVAIFVFACHCAPGPSPADVVDAAVADAGTDIVTADVPTDDPCNGMNFTDVLHGDVADAALPNVIPVISNVQIQSRTFSPGSCEVVEGCTLPGQRRLLRFDLVTPNIGAGDLYVGPPTVDSRPDSSFEFGVCHNHWHFRGYADYRLLDTAGAEIARGHKQSFCLLDSSQYMGMGQELCTGQRYTCTNQGIHAGYYDLYSRSLDCQYIDITGVPPGDYRIRARINTERGFAESNYNDNEALMNVTIPATDPVPTTVNPTDACATDETGAQRNCGWVVDRSFACTPGQMVTVACNAACTPGLGSCTGNPVMRVCPLDGPCVHSSMTPESDDACGTQCPSVTFPCTWIRYTVMTGGQRSGGAYECLVDISAR